MDDDAEEERGRKETVNENGGSGRTGLGVRLFFLGGSRDGEVEMLPGSGEYSFGRHECVYGFRDDDPVDKMVSRSHAALRVETDRVVLVNKRPSRGLWLFDSLEVEPEQEIELKDRDIFRLGKGGPAIEVRIGTVRDEE